MEAVQVLISNQNMLFNLKPATDLGSGFSAVQDTECLEQCELDFHMAYDPQC